MRNFIAKNSLVAVSANLKETVLNTFQDLDTSILVALASIIGMDWRREDNAGEMTGREEIDTLYDLGALTAATLDFPKMQPQHAAFICAYALGAVDTDPAGTGFEHTITPTDDILPSTFSAGMRLGKNVGCRQFAGLCIDSFNMVFDQDAWVTLSAAVKGTGKYEDDVIEETVQAPGNATQITVTSGDVLLNDIENVHLVRGEKATGEWHDAVVTDVSGDVIFIESIGGATATIDYNVIYRVTKTWATFPARVEEPPLRTGDLSMIVGGKWDGSAITGGHAMSTEINRVEWAFNNNMEVSFRPGNTGAYADDIIRGGRVQTVTIARRFLDWIFERKIINNDTFSLSLKAEGPEFDTGEKYTVWVVFPRVSVKEIPKSLDGRKLAETITLPVLEDETYGSVKVFIKNQVAQYASVFES